MKEHSVTLPELALIAGTRGMLGAGIGMLAAGAMSSDVRKAVGRSLLFVGIVTTIPLIMEVFGKTRRTRTDEDRQR